MNNLGRGKENEKKDKNKILTRIDIRIGTLCGADAAHPDHAFFDLRERRLRDQFVPARRVRVQFVCRARRMDLRRSSPHHGKEIHGVPQDDGFLRALFSLFVCLVHTITADVSGIAYGSYGGYLADCYTAGGNSFFATTGGGVIIGLVVYPVVKLLSSVGGYIIFSLLMLGTGFLVYRSVKKNGAEKQRAKERRAQKERAMVDSAAADTSGLYALNYAGLQDVSPAGTPDAIVREVSPQQDGGRLRVRSVRGDCTRSAMRST